jgi:hypothetical protein
MTLIFCSMTSRTYMRNRCERRDSSKVPATTGGSDSSNTYSKSKTKVVLNPGGKKGQLFVCANHAYQRVWKGYEYLSGFDKGDNAVKQDVSNCQSKVLEAQKSAVMGECCVPLSLLAQCADVEILSDIFLKKDMSWEAHDLHQAMAAIRTFGKRSRTTSNVWTLSLSAGAKPSLKARMTFGDSRTIHYLLVEDPDAPSWLHLLPVVKPNECFSIPATFRQQTKPAVEPPADDVKVEPPTLVEPAAEKAVEPDSPTSDGADSTEKWQVVPLANHFDWLIPTTIDVDFSPNFYGIRRPPSNFFWMGGWWSSQCPETAGEGKFSRMAAGVLFRPNVCSATLSNAVQHGSNCLYLPVSLDSQVWRIRGGCATVTDGVETADAFFSGDIVELDGRRYTAKTTSAYGTELLKLDFSGLREGLIDGSVRSILSSFIPFVDTASEARVIPMLGRPAVEERTVQKAIWTAVIHNETDSVKLAQLQRMRQDAAASGYEKDKPHDCKALVDQIARTFPQAKMVAGIPECFSCGVNTPGTYKGKLCKACAKGQNSSLGNLVAEGLTVAGPGCKVVYPGVVNTRSRHPPLKAGVETLATGQNFRLPREGERRLCPPPPSNE